MPNILKMDVIDGELWCCVGVTGEFESGVSLWTPKEQKDNYQRGYRDGLEAVEQERQDTHTELVEALEVAEKELGSIKGSNFEVYSKIRKALKATKESDNAE